MDATEVLVVGAPYGFFETSPDDGESIFELLRGPKYHLLYEVGRTEEDLRALLGSYGARISLHTVHAGNRSLHERYGAHSPSLFLVRPDGHVAYPGPATDLARLEAYLDRLFPKTAAEELAVTRSSTPVGKETDR